MQIWHDELKYDFTDKIYDYIFDDKSIFFDIETTGFSSARNTVYLIGCAARRGSTVIVDQFFAETPDEESNVISSFFKHLKDYTNIISFNGVGFDIPFLKGRAKKLGISENFDKFKLTDLYKEASALKNALNLSDCRQKTIERFLGIFRDDMYDGGQLIKVYNDFVKSKGDERKSLLKLHNYEDVTGMIDLLPIMSYRILTRGEFEVEALNADEYRGYNAEPGREIYITLSNSINIPKDFSASEDDIHIRIGAKETKLRIRLFEGELNYYIPGSKKDGSISSEYAIFLPQFDELFTPAYRKNKRDKKCYFMLSEQFVENKDMQKQYASHIMEAVIFSRRKTTSRAQSQSPYNP